MKIYPSYESTNDRFWNNDIPSNWGMKRIGSVFTQRNEKVSDTDYEPLSVTKKGIFPQWENVSKSDSHDDRKLVLKNDFVINSRSDRRGSSGLSKLDGSVSLINTVLTPSNEVEPKYSEYIFKSYEFINEFYKNGRGIVDDLWSTKYSLMKNIYICIPPLPEQSQIVSFLDIKTQKIDELIEKTEKKIELLKEKRTSLINHCVTKGLPVVERTKKGLNPNVEMKDSGVEWIGEIPSHWKSIKLKYFGFLFGGLSGKSGKDFNNEENPNNKPFIPFTNICDNTYISKDNMGMVSISEDDKQNRVEKFDLFFLMSSEDQEGIGKPSVLKNDLGEVYLNTFCKGFRITDEKYNSLFVNYLLSGHSYRELLSVEGNGFTRINLRSYKVSNFQIHYPTLEEQTQIVKYLDEQTQKIDTTIEKESQRITLLKEYRQSLISEVVTGKVDVRNYNG